MSQTHCSCYLTNKGTISAFSQVTVTIQLDVDCEGQRVRIGKQCSTTLAGHSLQSRVAARAGPHAAWVLDRNIGRESGHDSSFSKVPSSHCALTPTSMIDV